MRHIVEWLKYEDVKDDIKHGSLIAVCDREGCISFGQVMKSSPDTIKLFNFISGDIPTKKIERVMFIPLPE